MSEKETLSLAVINDNSINSGQKILIRTPDYHDLLLMYDDGADVAVWTGSEDDLLDLFPNAEKAHFRFVLVGFGKEYDITDVYKISVFNLTDESGGKLVVKNFHVALSERPDMAVGLILPGNLFNNTLTHIDRTNGKISVLVEYGKKYATRTMGVKQKTLSEKEIDFLKKQGCDDISMILSSTYCFAEE